ncbi:MAG TPA: wax ester/triacylglycerol synthase family O-acyltransferase [Acidimicrobiia bacterium]|nr:wax ester/triacylglycerol synthase family O-acyltransferase [Acidimicrobiia bacterium]
MRMSDAEAIMWAVEKDPALRSDFTNITVLDGRPDEGRIRAKLDAALADIPRLAQRVVAPPLRLAPPEWRDDPTLDLDYHLRKVAAPAPGGTRELLDVAAAFSATPLDRSRPLWEFTLVEGLEGGRTALLQKVHHAVTDGVGGVKLSLSLVDFEPDPASERVEEAARAPVDPVNRTTPLDVLSDALTFNVRNRFEGARRGIEAAGRFVAHPDEARRGLAGAAALAGSVRRQVLVTEPSRSELLRPRSLGRRFEVLQVPLDEAKRAASSLGGSLNDLFVTAVAGALGSYHDRMGEPCDELRMAMPVNLRTDRGEAAGNNFAPSRVLVPVAPKEPAARFEVIRQRIADVRREPALGAAGSLAGLLSALPTALLVTLTRSQARTIDFATSNLRGSPVDLYVGGARIAANFPMGPRTGCALNVTLLSYKGSLDLGLNLDPAAVTDPAALVECLDESFAALLAS